MSWKLETTLKASVLVDVDSTMVILLDDTTKTTTVIGVDASVMGTSLGDTTKTPIVTAEGAFLMVIWLGAMLRMMLWLLVTTRINWKSEWAGTAKLCMYPTSPPYSSISLRDPRLIYRDMKHPASELVSREAAELEAREFQRELWLRRKATRSVDDLD